MKEKTHPYTGLPDRAFWKRSFASPCVLPPERIIRLDEDDRIVSAGSCFASNLVPWLERWGLQYLRTEKPHNCINQMPENFGYRNFSAGYGNIYTTRQLLQLYQRALGLFRPQEDRWYENGHVIDPFRPGLMYPAESDVEFDLLRNQHLEAVRQAFESATVFVFTLGLTEAWLSKMDGAVYPACPGTIAGEFDASRHVFQNLTVMEIYEDFKDFIGLIHQYNPQLRFILTVSPVPLVATASGENVLMANIYSKSVLRVAAQMLANEFRDCLSYFPAYEIITGPQAPESFFEEDRRNVSTEGVERVMKSLYASTTLPAARRAARMEGRGIEKPRRPPVSSPETGADDLMKLSEFIANAECEELMMER